MKGTLREHGSHGAGQEGIRGIVLHGSILEDALCRAKGLAEAVGRAGTALRRNGADPDIRCTASAYAPCVYAVSRSAKINAVASQ